VVEGTVPKETVVFEPFIASDEFFRAMVLSSCVGAVDGFADSARRASLMRHKFSFSMASVE
jgi:hypothetical protein